MTTTNYNVMTLQCCQRLELEMKKGCGWDKAKE